MSLKAELSNGGVVSYLPDMIGEGAMKEVFFTEDKSHVVCFFKDNTDGYRRQRLDAVLGKFNPLNTANGDYWKDYFCWISEIVVKPRLGVVAPVYPKNYYFQEGPFKGKEKEGNWFFGNKTRSIIPKTELGVWINYFSIAIRLARAVRRLHQAGLAHSDLSPKNVLIDPSNGLCRIIDIDSLVVPQLFPPDVLGTRNYMAPEVIKTWMLPTSDPRKELPSIRTDLHALATLLYQYIFLRHPLQGPKVHKAQSAEEQEMLEMGEKALFIENPYDTSNRPQLLSLTCENLGIHLKNLFMKAFTTGLSSPDERPSALEWEKALQQTWDLLYPCPNSKCACSWFVFSQSLKKCPACGAKLKGLTVPVIELMAERRTGHWYSDGEIVIYEGMPGLFQWHIREGEPRAEGRNPERQGYFALQEGTWYLVNEKMISMQSPLGNHVSIGSAIEIKDGSCFRLSLENRSRLARVKLLKM